MGIGAALASAASAASGRPVNFDSANAKPINKQNTENDTRKLGVIEAGIMRQLVSGVGGDASNINAGQEVQTVKQPEVRKKTVLDNLMQGLAAVLTAENQPQQRATNKPQPLGGRNRLGDSDLEETL